MTNRVNGGGFQGTFLDKTMEFYTIATIVPLFNTNVDELPQDLYLNTAVTGTWSNVTVVDGTGNAQVYTTQQAYMDAWVKQTNLNIFINAFAGRTNPVAISVSNVQITGTQTASNTTVFGTSGVLFSFNNLTVATQNFGVSYNSIGVAGYPSQINILRFATEKASTWLVDTVTADSNANGFQLLGVNGLANNVTVYDTSVNVLQNSTFVTTITTGGAVVNISSSPFTPIYTLQTNQIVTSGALTNTIAQRKTSFL